MANAARRGTAALAADLRKPTKLVWWLRHKRLHQAWKSGLAAVVAWQTALLLPAPPGQYPYYAPLGAVLAMYPTVARSFQQAAHSLVAVCLGAVLAVAALWVSLPDIALVAAVVTLGVLIAFWRLVGSQASWVPASALLVLLIGGDEPLLYVAGYVGEIVLGLVIGVVVNFALFPPLHLDPSTRQLDALRTALAERLDELAAFTVGENGQDYDEWREYQRQTAPMVADVRTAVAQSDEARRANPRARWHRRQLDAQYEALRPLERVVSLIQDVDQVLQQKPAGRGLPLLDDGKRPLIAQALTDVANVMRASDDPDQMSTQLDEAERALAS